MRITFIADGSGDVVAKEVEDFCNSEKRVKQIHFYGSGQGISRMHYAMIEWND